MFFKQSLAPNSTMGWIYILLYFINFSVNFKEILGQLMFKTIPTTYWKAKKWIKDKKYKQRKEKYYRYKQRVALNCPDDKVSQYMWQETAKIEMRDKQNLT